jgi:hypothetical protein
MLTVRKSHERGHANHGWLDSRHTFSFGAYYDPAHQGYSDIRVINEDRVQPGQGFATHGHRDMEIISYVLSGALAHRDSLGNSAVIRPGEVQRMSAGTGVSHSEYNASQEESVHFLQIWILPDRPDYTPGYEQKYFGAQEKQNRLRVVASPDGREDSVTVHQDICLYSALLDKGVILSHRFEGGRKGYLQLVRGSVSVNGQALEAGDAVAIQDEKILQLESLGPENEPAELLLFDLR